MKINKLILNNVRSIEGELNVTLSEDCSLNLVSSSNNGMGKTTLFHTVYFLLFGITPDTIEAMVNWNSSSMSCSIEFEHNGIQFSISYSYDDGKTEKSLIINGEQFNGITVCNKKIKEYFDPSLFIGATRLLQNEKNFVNVKDSERRDSLKKVFNTDYSAEVKDLEKEIKDLETIEIKKIQDDILTLNAQTFEDKEIKELPITPEEYTKNSKDLSEINIKIASINQSIINIKKEEQELASNKSKLSSCFSDIMLNEVKLEKANTELSSFINYKRDESFLSSLKNDLSLITLKRIKPFDDSELNKKIEDLNNVLSDLRGLSKQLLDCKSGKCPTCKKAFEGHDVEAIQKNINDLHIIKSSLEVEIDLIKTEKKSIEDEIKKNEEEKNKRILLENKIEAEEKRLDTLDESNYKLKSLKETEAQNIKDTIASLNLTKSELELVIASTNIKTTDELVKEKSNLEVSAIPISNQIRSYDLITMENSINAKHNEDNIKKREKVLEEKSNYEQVLLVLQEKKIQLEKMKVFLKKEFPSYVISAVIQDIQDSMNEFINKVYYKPLDVTITGDDDVISVKYGTGSRKVDCINASGAEEALLAISYCMALNKIQGFSIFFLDEVDANFTEANSLQLAEIMIGLKDELDSCWVISHVDKTKDLYSANGANVIMVGE